MRIIVGVVALFLTLSACSGADTATPSATPSASQSPSFSTEFTTPQDEMLPAMETYVNDLFNVGTLENKVMNDFTQAFSKEYKVNAKLAARMNEIVADAESFTLKLSAISVTTPELEYFHSEYVRVWNEKLSVFKKLQVATSAADKEEINTLLAEYEVVQSQIAPLSSLFDRITSYSGLDKKTP